MTLYKNALMFLIFLPFSLLRTRPKQPCGPPRSALPPPCGPAGSRARGNTQSGPCCSAASQPGKDPTTQKEAPVNRNDRDALPIAQRREERGPMVRFTLASRIIPIYRRKWSRINMTSFTSQTQNELFRPAKNTV